MKTETIYRVQSIVAGDRILVGGRPFVAGSVIDYAREYKCNPVEAISRAIERGTELYWLNQEATVIASRHTQEPAPAATLDFGGLVEFDGTTYSVERAPNRNAKLVEWTHPDAEKADAGEQVGD